MDKRSRLVTQSKGRGDLHVGCDTAGQTKLLGRSPRLHFPCAEIRVEAMSDPHWIAHKGRRDHCRPVRAEVGEVRGRSPYRYVDAQSCDRPVTFRALWVMQAVVSLWPPASMLPRTHDRDRGLCLRGQFPRPKVRPRGEGRGSETLTSGGGARDQTSLLVQSPGYLVDGGVQ